MSQPPLKICTAAGCNAVTRSSRCDRHKKERRTPDTNRPSAHKRGYNSRWNKASKTWLSKADNALCCYCKKRGRIVPASLVDHYIPHKGDQQLFWDKDNWRPCCSRCNNSKGDTMPKGTKWEVVSW